MTGIKDTREQRRAEKNLVDTRIMRSFGETPGKREALLNKLVKISETPVKREETPEKGEEPVPAKKISENGRNKWRKEERGH